MLGSGLQGLPKKGSAASEGKLPLDHGCGKDSQSYRGQYERKLFWKQSLSLKAATEDSVSKFLSMGARRCLMGLS